MDIVETTNIENKGFVRHPWEIARAKFINMLFDSVKLRLDRPVTGVVDVGCGDAFLAGWMAGRNPGVPFHGVDPALQQEFIQKTMSRQSLANLNIGPSLEQLDCPDNSVDIVTFLDVLEHLVDDVAVLKSYVNHPAVKENACFLMISPAMQSLYCSHDRLLGHQRRYSLKQLHQLADNAGLNALEGGYCCFSGFWVRAMRCVLEHSNILPPMLHTQTSDWQGNNLLTTVAEKLLTLDFYSARFFAKAKCHCLPGLSCYLICQKRG
jgi:hypothetical protein